MLDKEDGRKLERLSSTQVKQVLERAVAIDISASESLSLDHLRSVAVEAGISQAALAAALREMREAEDLNARLNSTSEAHRAEAFSGSPYGRIPRALRGRVALLAAGAIGASALIGVALLVFMWLVPGILQHFAQ